jgi:hypothetical protein
MYRQWPLYGPHSGHYMNGQWSLYVPPVVTICTAQRSLYEPPAVTICTAQWSLYVPPVVTICTASGHYMYRTVVTIGTTILTCTNSTFRPHTVFMCFVWISEQTAIISVYSINWLVCITETECVYCAVRTGTFNTFQVTFRVQNLVVYNCLVRPLYDPSAGILV